MQVLKDNWDESFSKYGEMLELIRPAVARRRWSTRSGNVSGLNCSRRSVQIPHR